MLVNSIHTWTCKCNYILSDMQGQIHYIKIDPLLLKSLSIYCFHKKNHAKAYKFPFDPVKSYPPNASFGNRRQYKSDIIFILFQISFLFRVPKRKDFRSKSVFLQWRHLFFSKWMDRKLFIPRYLGKGCRDASRVIS